MVICNNSNRCSLICRHKIPHEVVIVHDNNPITCQEDDTCDGVPGMSYCVKVAASIETAYKEKYNEGEMS